MEKDLDQLNEEIELLEAECIEDERIAMDFPNEFLQQEEQFCFQTIKDVRGSGKTTWLIEQALKDKGFIVCCDMHGCSQIDALSKGRVKTITFDSFLRGDHRRSQNNIYHFDNIEMILDRFCKSYTGYCGNITASSEPRNIVGRSKINTIDYCEFFSKGKTPW